MCFVAIPGKLDDKAKRTRLDTELGPRGNKEDPDVGVEDGVLVEGEGLFVWILQPPPICGPLDPPPTLPTQVPRPPTVPPPPLVLRRAIAANVSNKPAGFVCSIPVELAAEVRLGTLMLIGFVEEGPRPLLTSFSFLPK